MKAIGFLFASVALSSLSGAVRAAEFYITDHSVSYSIDDEIIFSLTFNVSPDFFIVDSLGRQENSFQYHIYGDESLPYPENYSYIIRGEEIHVSNNLLRVRDTSGNYESPISGGWGAIVAEVPWTTIGATLSFVIDPAELPGFLRPDGTLKYDVKSYSYGSETTEPIESPVPVPAAAWLFGSGLLGLAGFVRKRKSA